MTEAEARCVAAVRAFETPITPPWSEADARWASDEARRAVGESAGADLFLSERARLALKRLAGRVQGLTPMLQGQDALRYWPAVVLATLLLALLLGAGIESIGADGRIHLLAPPLAALLLWNLAVLAVSVVLLLRRAAHTGRAGDARSVRLRGVDARVSRAMEALLARIRGGAERGAGPGASAQASAQTSAMWRAQALAADASRPATAARVTALLHAAAAVVVVGALLSMYARGLGFEFRAGWDSTFLSASQAHALVSGLLGPAAQVLGWPLPTPEAFASLRFSQGAGAPAAPWIHAWALTLGVGVVLPRSALALLAWAQARRRAQRVEVDLADPYFARLAAQQGQHALDLVLLPYAHRPGAELTAWLQAALARRLGPRTRPLVLAAVMEGDEDQMASHTEPVLRASVAAASTPRRWAVLTSLTATPERETHGRFVEALATHLHLPIGNVLLLVNEAGFGARLSAADAEQRRRHRRAAWQRLADDLGCPLLFLDPLAPAADGPAREQADDALAAALNHA
jgi:hypothetical protein